MVVYGFCRVYRLDFFDRLVIEFRFRFYLFRSHFRLSLSLKHFFCFLFRLHLYGSHIRLLFVRHIFEKCGIILKILLPAIQFIFVKFTHFSLPSSPTGHNTPFITSIVHYTEKTLPTTIWFLSKIHPLLMFLL